MSRTLLGFAVVVLAALTGCSSKATDAVKEAGDSATHAMGEAAADATAAAQSAGDALGAGFSAAAEKASAALKDVAGGPELMKNVTDLFTSATTSLKGVKDEASAKAALPSLDELIGKAGGLSAMAEKLPAEANTAISGLIESGLAPLKELVAKIMAIPGVESVVKPKVDELMAKLTALTSRP